MSMDEIFKGDYGSKIFIHADFSVDSELTK